MVRMESCKYPAEAPQAVGAQGLAEARNLVVAVLAPAVVMPPLLGLVDQALVVMQTHHMAALAALAVFAVPYMLAYDNQEVPGQGGSQELQVPYAGHYRHTELDIDHTRVLLHDLVTRLFSSYQHRVQHLEHETKGS